MPAPSLLLGIALGLVHGLTMVGLHHQIHSMEPSNDVLYPSEQLVG